MHNICKLLMVEIIEIFCAFLWKIALMAMKKQIKFVILTFFMPALIDFI